MNESKITLHTTVRRWRQRRRLLRLLLLLLLRRLGRHHALPLGDQCARRIADDAVDLAQLVNGQSDAGRLQVLDGDVQMLQLVQAVEQLIDRVRGLMWTGGVVDVGLVGGWVYGATHMDSSHERTCVWS